MKNASVMFLLQRAYGVEDFQIDGTSGWLRSETFDLDAKMDNDVAVAFNKLVIADKTVARQHMLRAILADRFRLTMHRETREVPVFLLEIAKKGSKLHEATPGDTYSNGLKTPDGQSEGAGATMTTRTAQGETLQAQAVPITSLLRVLTLLSLGKPVQDRTGLAGKYDFTLKWSPESPLSASAPDGTGVPTASDPSETSIFTALKEQLGLELISGKGNIDFIVIDHVERPTSN